MATDTLCIVCGSDDSVENLEYGETHGAGYWYHRKDCLEKLNRVGKLTFKIWFPTQKKFKDALDSIIPNSFPNTAVLIGAGISIPSGVPGYKRLLLDLSAQIGKEVSAQSLQSSVHKNSGLHKSVAAIFARLSRRVRPGYAHHSIAELMLDGNFSIVVNMNWDMLLERVFERVLEIANENYARMGRFKKSGLNLVVTDDDIHAHSKGENWNRHTIVKIHGSPLLYFCPHCSGTDRFRSFDVVHDGSIFCPLHPGKALDRHLVFTGGHLDSASKVMQKFLIHEFKHAKQILLIGYSGRDDYILNNLIRPNRARVWNVAPSILASKDPSWESTPKSQRIDATATAFFRMWYLYQLIYPAPYHPFIRGLSTQKILHSLGEIELSDELDVTRFYHPHLF